MNFSSVIRHPADAPQKKFQRFLGKNFNAQTLKAIRFLEEQGALKTLPEALQQAAARRLEYPDLSLAALCGCFDPPMSKSGLSHRMKKLEALADALRQRLEEHTETEEAGA